MFTGHININRKDVHASMISINGKYIKTRKRFSEKPIVAFTNSTVFILDFYI